MSRYNGIHWTTALIVNWKVSENNYYASTAKMDRHFLLIPAVIATIHQSGIWLWNDNKNAPSNLQTKPDIDVANMVVYHWARRPLIPARRVIVFDWISNATDVFNLSFASIIARTFFVHTTDLFPHVLVIVSINKLRVTCDEKG